MSHAITGNRWEIRRLDNSFVGPITLPPSSASAGQTQDGLGIIAIQGDWSSSVEVVSIDGGKPRVLASGAHDWPEAWMPDGSGVIADGRDAEGSLVRILQLQGRASNPIRLPGDMIWGRWSSSIGPWYSYRTPAGPGTDVLHAVNVQTGETRDVATDALRIGIVGRAGLDQDGSEWLWLSRPDDGSPLELHAADPATGRSRLVRRIPDVPGNRDGFSVNGDRIAFMVARGDSLDLMISTRASEEPHRIATFSKDGDTVTWSFDGTRIAVADGGLWLITLRPDGTLAREIRRYQLGVEHGCQFFRWTLDDSQIVMLCYGDSVRIMKLRMSDGRLSTVVPSETPQKIWEYSLSPGGKQVVYPVQTDRHRSSVYVVDLKPLLPRTR